MAASSTNRKAGRTGSHVFRLPSSSQVDGVQRQLRTGSPGQTNGSLDQLQPRSIDELAVHPKKIEAVQTTLRTMLNQPCGKRLLVVRGPAGSGKSETVRLVTSQLGARLNQWQAGAGERHGNRSAATHLTDFLQSATRFGCLAMDDEETAGDGGGSVVLIDDFPAAPAGMASFRAAILALLDEPTGPTGMAGRLVLAVTESATTFSSGQDRDEITGLTAYGLLGPDVLEHPATISIEFNRVAPTVMTKALKLAAARLSETSRSPVCLDTDRLACLAAGGDIRNALSALQFLHQAQGQSRQTSRPSGARKRKRSQPQPDAAQASRNDDGTGRPDDPTGTMARDSTIGLFHAVGKVVYNSRSEPTSEAIDPDWLLASAGTDSRLFVATVQENALLSCQAADGDVDPTSTCDCMAACADALSLSDMLSSPRFSSRAGATADLVVLDHFSFHIAIRGVCETLPMPVRRLDPPNTLSRSVCAARSGVAPTHVRPVGRSDRYKMFFPTSARIWRQVDQADRLVQQLVRMAADGLLLPRLSAPDPGGRKGPEAMGRPSRLSVLAEIAPYAAMIQAADRRKAGPPVFQGHLSILDRLCRVTGSIEADSDMPNCSAMTLNDQQLARADLSDDPIED